MKDYKLIIFDMDGTLADRDTAELLDGVKEYFASLGDDMPKFSLATNQGGVGLRYWMERDSFGEPEKYPDLSQVTAHVTEVFQQIKEVYGEEIRFDWLWCFAYITRKGKFAPIPDKYCLSNDWNPNFRKPSPGMLMQAISNAEVKPKETLMVGDRDEDKEAAGRTGCDFMWAWEFFGRDKPDET